MKKIYLLLKKGTPFFFLILVFSLFTASVKSQALDSKGTDFWLTFAGNYTGGSTLSFFISGDQNTTGNVTIPGLGFSVNFSVTAGTVTTVVLPASADLGASSNIVTNLGIHVVAAQEVTVYGLSRLQYTTDAYLGLPTDILGTEYIVLGYKNSNVVNGTQFAMVATQNATIVSITPTLTTDGHAAGVPYNITLNQGQTYQVRNTGLAPADLSGTIITSNKPIAVFGGHQCANIPPGALACDFVVEELPPTNAWGKNFVTVPLKTRKNGDTFRFLASKDGTTVSVNGSVVANLNRGQLYEELIVNSSQITSNQPILVAQYSNGTTYDGVTSDPFMMLIPPYEQFLGNYTFATPASGFTFNFVNVVAPAAAVGTLRLDGVIIPAAAFTPIGSTGFSGAQLDLSLGAHTINGTSLPFGIFVYGFDYADSYGYPGGQSLAPIATVTTLALTPETGTAVVGTEQCFDALVKDQLNNPVIGVRVDFNITGANPGSTGFANTNASGIAHFCYTGVNAGTDNIVASTGLIKDNPSTFVWTKVPVVSDYYSKASGNLHDVLTWGVNLDGSGANPPDFGSGKTFHLVNRVPAYTMTANWTVGGRIDIPAGSQLRINGFTLSEADLIGTGTLFGSLTSNLIVAGTAGGNAGVLNFAGGGGILNNLTLNRTGPSASASISSSLAIYGVLTLSNGILTTNNNVTLKSNITGTARVAPVTGSISGNVTVERFIPARRAWRIMSAPVGGSQKINAAWQEGATTSSAIPNPNPGYGTFITEGSAASGFDHNPLIAMVSIKRYVSATDTWSPLTNTNANNVNSDAYLLFVRGNRGTALGLNTVPATITTLRATGPLKTGDQTFTVNATGFTAVPNPYASPINFATITRNNVQNNFYLYDPKLGGATGVGGYVLLSFNGSGYDITPAPVSPESQLIQSGQGFMVHSTGGTGSITIKESDKSATAATNVFRSSNITKALRTSLQITDEDKSTPLLDETFSSYSPDFSNQIDDMDAVKPANMNENIGITRDGQSLMIERRQDFTGRDTIHLQVWNTIQRKYMLEFNPVNLSSSISAAFLQDKYLNTSTPVSSSEKTIIRFSVDQNAASADKDRFSVILTSKKAIDITSADGVIKLASNPVTGNVIGIQFINQPAGAYNVTLFNSLGQKVHQERMIYPGGSATQTLRLTNKIEKGIYRMRVSNEHSKTTSALPVLVN